MDVVSTVRALRTATAKLGKTAFVPTMGNLHEGHLSLVRHAAVRGLPVVVSIFVNPMQFGPTEDFENYPRTLENDLALLEQEGVSLVFTPDKTELYPELQTWKVAPAPELADILEGACRPGFFTGVATVVLKLFNLVRPEIAVFGKKDYQQLLIIKAMCRQFALPIEIIAGETVRTPDGLALSSRNLYLTPAEQTEALALRRGLLRLAEQVRLPAVEITTLEQAIVEDLTTRGWKVDYIAVRNQTDLTPLPTGGDVHGHPLVILGAAYINKTRLIDSLELSEQS